MRQRWSAASRSQQRFQIRAHYLVHSANPCVVEERLHTRPLPLAAEPKRLDGHVEADLVAVFEAVGDCLFGTVDPDGLTIHLVGLYPLAERLAGEPEDAQRWIVQHWFPEGPWQGNVDLMRDLRGDFMESQG